MTKVSKEQKAACSAGLSMLASQAAIEIDEFIRVRRKIFEATGLWPNTRRGKTFEAADEIRLILLEFSGEDRFDLLLERIVADAFLKSGHILYTVGQLKGEAAEVAKKLGCPDEEGEETLKHIREFLAALSEAASKDALRRSKIR